MQRGVGVRRRVRRGRPLRRRLLDDLDTAREADPEGETLLAQIAAELTEKHYGSLGFDGKENARVKKDCCFDSSVSLEPVGDAYSREQKQTIDYYRKLTAEVENGNKRAFESIGISKTELLKRYSNWMQRNEKEIEEGSVERVRLQEKYAELVKQAEKLQKSIDLTDELLKNLNSK